MRSSLCEYSFALILTGAIFLATAGRGWSVVYVETRDAEGVPATGRVRVHINYE
jgi:hypothetical protein